MQSKAALDGALAVVLPIGAMQSLEVNAPFVVAEVFEQEVVVIDLDRGTYYSLGGAATRIWPLLGQGLDGAQIAARVAVAAGGAPGVAESVLGFLAELEREGLIRAAAAGGNGKDHAPELTPIAVFEPPRLEKFTDMQELIALDPVHDVSDAEGWPIRVPLGPEST